MIQNNIKLYFNTFKYLKFKQIFYRIYYYIKKYVSVEWVYHIDSIQLLKIHKIKKNENLYFRNKFTFLNKSKKFDKIDWEFLEYGKLWNYHLHYFDYLNQTNMNKSDGVKLIHNYIKNFECKKINKDPYPTSVRLINWIKFLSEYQINDDLINNYILNDSLFLYDNVEYHLMGNHVLENAFSLLFSSYFLKNIKLYRYSRRILYKELEEQILSDGAHFELSTMYHQIILYKLLDSIQLMSNNENWKQDNFLLDFLKNKARNMLGWIDAISYDDGSLPALNDSAKNCLDVKQSFFDYAKKINLNCSEINLKESGYRRWNNDKFQILIDVGQIGASYIPGHAHADTLNFELIYNDKPIIVDPGISTYENNETRFLEKSTDFHNTLKIDNKNSSEIWNNFRVAERANISELIEDKFYIKASHDGYRKYGLTHSRIFNLLNNKFIIKDIIDSNKNDNFIESFLHFHPDCEVSIIDNTIRVNDEIIIYLTGYSKLRIEEYKFPLGFNECIISKKIVFQVSMQSKLEIQYEN
jgi:hypothetical protein